jgi:DNA modification methylase
MQISFMDDRPHGRSRNEHPTVKPLNLMRYLVRLICAKGCTVLDPFMGSGSTGCAAITEGMQFVGIDQSQQYADIAIGRLNLSLEGEQHDME